ARQLVKHGHFLVNGKKVDIPSYEVDKGDIIEVREKSKKLALFKENLESRDPRSVPRWLELDKDNLRGKVVEIPEEIELEIPVNVQYIIEYYSM
ncbi:MAG: 30S ribosomal protein S4, partial [Sulfurihydrogenibium sp.]|nr:30S ribosomal protein S4 [Sulfurihydrogenibium sp.]